MPAGDQIRITYEVSVGYAADPGAAEPVAVRTTDMPGEEIPVVEPR